MYGAELVVVRRAVYIQLIQALCAPALPLAVDRTNHTAKSRGVYPGGTPIDGSLCYHPLSSGGGSLVRRPRASQPLIYGQCGILRGLERRGAQMMKLILDQGRDQGYFYKIDKYLFIADSSSHEASPQQKF